MALMYAVDKHGYYWEDIIKVCGGQRELFVIVSNCDRAQDAELPFAQVWRNMGGSEEEERREIEQRQQERKARRAAALANKGGAGAADAGECFPAASSRRL